MAQTCVKISVKTPPLALAVFDFDHTVLDCNSDIEIFTALGASDAAAALRATKMQWTDAVDHHLGELHAERGGASTRAPIEAALRAMGETRIPPRSRAALQRLLDAGCRVVVASDSNSVFIAEALAGAGLPAGPPAIEIVTNPAAFDASGRLRVERLVKGEGDAGHGCAVCAVNMCKGLIVDELLAELAPGARAMYVGDGNNDYCPSRRLRAGDIVLPRAGMALDKRICADPDAISARVRVWRTYDDLDDFVAEALAQS
jgi:pyridoxal phosphate phosphatase PHOSPHO2